MAYHGKLIKLEDTTIEASVANLEILSYNSSSGKWINRTLAELGLSSIENGTVQGQLPYWDTTATKWLHSTGIIWDETNNILKIPGSTTNSSLQVGGIELQSISVNDVYIANDVYFNGSVWKLRNTTSYSTGALRFYRGAIYFYSAPSGTAGDTVSLTQMFQVASNGNAAVQGTLTIGSTYILPASIGSALQVLRVPAAGTTLEWYTPTGSMVYPGAGIALSTGSAWGTSINNNSSNWNTAYGWGNHAGLYYDLVSGTTIDGDGLAISSDDAIYIGAKATDGTWRINLDGNDLEISRHNGSDYIIKAKILN